MVVCLGEYVHILIVQCTTRACTSCSISTTPRGSSVEHHCVGARHVDEPHGLDHAPTGDLPDGVVQRERVLVRLHRAPRRHANHHVHRYRCPELTGAERGVPQGPCWGCGAKAHQGLLDEASRGAEGFTETI
jgi:hypothetical protein